MDTEQYPQCDRYPPGVEQADVKKREERKILDALLSK
jgi:hypothetical protein